MGSWLTHCRSNWRRRGRVSSLIGGWLYLFKRLDQLSVCQCTRRLRRHSLTCRRRRSVGFAFCFGERVALALRRRGAAAQADARRVDLRDDDGEGGGSRQSFDGRHRREPSARRSNRILGSAASSDGRRTVAVTAARGRTVGRSPSTDQGRTVFHLPSTLGVLEAVRSETSGRI